MHPQWVAFGAFCRGPWEGEQSASEPAPFQMGSNWESQSVPIGPGSEAPRFLGSCLFLDEVLALKGDQCRPYPALAAMITGKNSLRQGQMWGNQRAGWPCGSSAGWERSRRQPFPGYLWGTIS